MSCLTQPSVSSVGVSKSKLKLLLVLHVVGDDRGHVMARLNDK